MYQQLPLPVALGLGWSEAWLEAWDAEHAHADGRDILDIVGR